MLYTVPAYQNTTTTSSSSTVEEASTTTSTFTRPAVGTVVGAAASSTKKPGLQNEGVGMSVGVMKLVVLGVGLVGGLLFSCR